MSVYALSPGAKQDLCALLLKNPLFAFDYDGTLAPYPKTPSAVSTDDKVFSALQTLGRKFPTYIVTGRESSSLKSMVPAGMDVIGNHGGDKAGLSPEQRSALKEKLISWKAELEKALPADKKDYLIELKSISFTLHYPPSLTGETLPVELQACLRRLTTWARLIPGKFVVNVIPQELPNKGQAVLQCLKQHGSEALLFAGDDVTDEDVFSLDLPIPFFSLRIGKSQTTRAKYYLDNQSEMSALLNFVVENSRR